MEGLDPAPVPSRHDFGELPDETVGRGAARPIERVHDVVVTVSVELGRVQLSMGQLLTLAPGSVIALDRDAGAPVDILANGRLVAQGEVVVRGEELGVRLDAIAATSPDDASTPPGELAG